MVTVVTSQPVHFETMVAHVKKSCNRRTRRLFIPSKHNRGDPGIRAMIQESAVPVETQSTAVEQPIVEPTAVVAD